MRYYITEGGIDMVISEWDNKRKILFLTQEFSERTTEEEAGQGETQSKEMQVPKKRRTGQGKTTQTNEGPLKTRTQNGKNDKTQSAKEQQKQDEVPQGTTSCPKPQELGGNTRIAMKKGGPCKKMKAQRTPPEYTIMNDDREMIARMVQDCLAEDFDHIVENKDIIQEELENI